MIDTNIFNAAGLRESYTSTARGFDLSKKH